MSQPHQHPWQVQRDGRTEVARDSDGYRLRIAPTGDTWHWAIRPPGGGYDVLSGSAPDSQTAKKLAEHALADLYREIREAMQ